MSQSPRFSLHMPTPMTLAQQFEAALKNHPKRPGRVRERPASAFLMLTELLRQRPDDGSPWDLEEEGRFREFCIAEQGSGKFAFAGACAALRGFRHGLRETVTRMSRSREEAVRHSLFPSEHSMAGMGNERVGDGPPRQNPRRCSSDFPAGCGRFVSRLSVINASA